MTDHRENFDIFDDAMPTPPAGAPGFDLLIWQPSVFMSISEQIETIGKRDCPVIITGETGTAKENLARQIHNHSDRVENAFIPVSCSTLGDRILEAQLFGQVFESSNSTKSTSLGCFRAAEGGTIFLDNIDKLSIQMQSKLLHTLRNRSISPVGSIDQYPFNIRPICSSSIDLRDAVQQDEFIPDLYFYLNIATIELPPLRHRADDIAIMAKYFLDLHAQMYNDEPKGIDPAALNALKRYQWPGNVSELANIMERAFVMSKSDKISIDDLPGEILTSDIVNTPEDTAEFPALDDVGRKLVIRALEKTKGQKMSAAKLLKIDHRKLNRLIKKYDLHIDKYKQA